MALSYKSMQAGMDALLVMASADVVTGIVAAGTTQATATHLDSAKNFVGTAAAGSGVRLSINAVGGDDQFVYNGGANALRVYPPVGAQINNVGVNNPVILSVNTGCLFNCGSMTQWGAVLSA